MLKQGYKRRHDDSFDDEKQQNKQKPYHENWQFWTTRVSLKSRKV